MGHFGSQGARSMHLYEANQQRWQDDSQVHDSQASRVGLFGKVQDTRASCSPHPGLFAKRMVAREAPDGVSQRLAWTTKPFVVRLRTNLRTMPMHAANSIGTISVLEPIERLDHRLAVSFRFRVVRVFSSLAAVSRGHASCIVSITSFLLLFTARAFVCECVAEPLLENGIDRAASTLGRRGVWKAPPRGQC